MSQELLSMKSHFPIEIIRSLFSEPHNDCQNPFNKSKLLIAWHSIFLSD